MNSYEGALKGAVPEGVGTGVVFGLIGLGVRSGSVVGSGDAATG